jgi:hypothetical protein
MSVWWWQQPEEEQADSSRMAQQKLSRLFKHVAAVCDRGLHRILGSGCGACVRAAVAWYVLCNCWLLCKVSAGM